MSTNRSHLRVAAALAASLLALTTTTPLRAQFAVGGVYVDAEGMLKQAGTLSDDERLALTRAAAFAPPESNDLSTASPLRKVSLRRLEAVVEQSFRENKPLAADLRYLAGLNRLTHVFFYPEAGDVVIAGPAEGWTQAADGRAVGSKSNRPPLELDDLIVALRYAFRDEPAASFIGCSIEPTAEGVQRYAAYMKQLRGIDRSRVAQIFGRMERAMGPQAVKLYGVDGSSRFALKLVAADYRLKRIALGHDPSPVKGVANYLDLAARRLRPGPQRQHRWWFVGEYEAVYHTPDNLAWELEGQGVRIATAPTGAADKGGKSKQQNTPEAAPAARQFAAAMTKHYAVAAARLPIFAELQNLIGLSVAAELTAQRSEEDERGWRPVLFLDGQSCPLAAEPVPQFVPSLANYRLVKNRHWLISISGGVEINTRKMTDRTVRIESPGSGKLSKTRESVRPPAAGHWWWD